MVCGKKKERKKKRENIELSTTFELHFQANSRLDQIGGRTHSKLMRLHHISLYCISIH